MQRAFEDHIVQRLASETGRTENEARRVFHDQIEAFDRDARIKSYVPAIALRHAREILRRH